MVASPAFEPPGSTTGWLSRPPALARARPAARSSSQVAGGSSPSASSAARRYHRPATSASAWTAKVRPWVRPVSISGVRKSCSYSPVTQPSSSSSSGARNPAAVNSGTQTESRTARSGPRPSATACVSAWWSSCSSTVATLNLVSAGAARRISPSQGPSGRITRSSGTAPVPVHPVRVHERAPPAVADDHPLGGQLRQRPGHRRPADLVLFAQLMLGGETAIQPVAAFQDLLEQQRLELEVDRYGQLRIDGHGTPPPRLYRLGWVGGTRVASTPSRPRWSVHGRGRRAAP